MNVVRNIRDLGISDLDMPTEFLWWPLTLASWLGILVIIILIGFAVWAILEYRKRKVVSFVNNSLNELFERYKNDFDATAFARGVSVLFKRIYLTINRRSEVAGLSGIEWLRMLDQGLQDKPFTTGVGKVLLSAPYQEMADYDVESLYQLCLRRIETLRLVT